MRLNRLSRIACAVSRATLWLYAHFTLEWLFHATKPSTVSVAPLTDRVILLLAAPLTAWVIVALAAGLMASIGSGDSVTRRAWLPATVPGLVATGMLVVAADNFTRTVSGAGIGDTAGLTRALLLAVVLVSAWLLVRREAGRLMNPRHARVAIAAGLVVISAATSVIAEVPAAAARNETRPVPLHRRAAPNFLLIGIDGLDATDLSPYGAAAGASPVLAAMAERGVVFENAFSNAGRTYGSLIGTLSGRLPTETHILFPPPYLTGAAATDHMPALLRRHGYTTAQIGMRHYADAIDWNMRGGFDVVNGRVQTGLAADRTEERERLRRYRREIFERVADRVLHLLFIRRIEDAQAFLASKGSRSPYFADARRLQLAREFMESRREPWMMNIHLLDTHCCPEDRVESIRAADRSVGRLVAWLESTAQAGRTIVVVYSDHTPRWGTLGRVPLIVVRPGGPQGLRIRENAQLADIAPTILELAGIARPPWMSGTNLFAAIDAKRPIYSLVEIAQTAASGPEMKIVQDASAPLYGAASAAVIVCDQFVKYSFGSQRLRAGRIGGHTAPCSDDLRIEADSLLRAHLARNGYPAPPAAPGEGSY